MKKINLVILTIIVLSFIIAIYFYSKMPDIVASHWGVNGQVNGYMPKFWALFLLPIMSIGLFLLFLLLPLIDPLKANIKKFRKYFDLFIALVIIFLFYLYVLTISWNLGNHFDMKIAILPGVGLIFYFAGVLMEHSKRNWFIGMRTPWTISNDKVWDKTNKLAAKFFKVLGIVTIICIFLPAGAFWIIFCLAIAFTIYLVLYSYLEYNKLKKK